MFERENGIAAAAAPTDVPRASGIAASPAGHLVAARGGRRSAAGPSRKEFVRRKWRNPVD